MNNNQPNDDFVSGEVFMTTMHTVIELYTVLNNRVKTLEEIHDIQPNQQDNNEQPDSNAAVGAAASGGRRRKNKKKSRRRRRRRKRQTR